MVAETNSSEKPVNIRANIWSMNNRKVYEASKNILGVMQGVPEFYLGIRPENPAAFRCCYQLLEYIPEWKERLHEVADAYPAWIPFIRDWNILTTMHDHEMLLVKHQEINNPYIGNPPAMNAYMKELLTEGDEHAKMVADAN